MTRTLNKILVEWDFEKNSLPITKGDFVRMFRKGPQNLREHLWFYQYKEGLIDVPLNWHLALLKIDLGGLLLPWIKKAVEFIVCFIPESRRGE